MRQLRLLAFLLAMAVASQGAIIFVGDLVASDLEAKPAGTTFAEGPHGGGGVEGGAIPLVVGSPGILTITLDDCCFVGDVFEVILNGVSLGLTTEVELDGPTNSSGVFAVGVGSGAHTLDFWDITVSYIGSASPFGGGVVPDLYSPAGFSVVVDFEPGVALTPEPSSYAMILSGLAGVLFMARRRRA